MVPITNPERRILDGLTAFIRQKSYPPTQRELAKQVGLKSPNTVHYHLKNLEEKGLVRYPKNRSRAIELVAGNSPFVARIPVLGSVTAGIPNLAAEDFDEWVEIGRSFVKGKVFGLRVKGNSMKDAGILPKDIVIVRVQPTVEEGEIVVARFQDETTVKYLKRNKEGSFLVPANKDYEPISAKDAEIVGKVIGVIRKY